MSLPPVPNTQIKSDNVWLGWFRRIQEILSRWVVVVGTSLTLRTNNIVRLQIDSLGNVGIGAIPTDKLTVVQNDNGIVARVVNTFIGSGFSYTFNVTNNVDADCITRISHVGSGTKFAAIGPSVNVPFVLMTADTERLRIKTTGQIRLRPLAADPADLEDGDMWYNSTAGKFRGRAAGVTVDFH